MKETKKGERDLKYKYVNIEITDSQKGIRNLYKVRKQEKNFLCHRRV